MTDALRNTDLDRALAAAAAEIDSDIAATGSAGRVSAAILAGIVAAPLRRARWFAIAAALLIAAGLGSIAELTIIGATDDQRQNTVVLDPMVFGPTGADAQ